MLQRLILSPQHAAQTSIFIVKMLRLESRNGRPVPLVKRFYDGYFGITAGFHIAAPDGEEDWSVWDRSKYRKDPRSFREQK